MSHRIDITGSRAIAECAACGERVPMSHVTEAWQKRHEHIRVLVPEESGPEPTDSTPGA